ncbi:MAG: FKBP-type peptidyl-prolyl cis-trans isomerase [Bacteroidales bacterium]|nr:FKBP-type peptidyl-prolyl cis-trans isomerase [Bacteroidales bacterium]
MNRMKQLLVVAGLLTFILTACNKPNYNVKISTETDSISYLIGIHYGKQLKSGGELSSLNVDALAKGLNEAFNKDSLKISDEELSMQLNMLFMRLQKRVSEKNLKEGQEFMAKNKTKPGVQTTPTGLQYQVVKEGTGPMPDSSSLVTTHYTLYHINGEKVESSVGAEPAKFKVTQVIPGWTEALLKMRVGSKWKLFVPAELGYGERVGRGSPLKPNEALIFDIELLNIEKDTQQGPPQN